MVTTAEVVTSVLLDGGVAEAFAAGAVWEDVSATRLTLSGRR